MKAKIMLKSVSALNRASFNATAASGVQGALLPVRE